MAIIGSGLGGTLLALQLLQSQNPTHTPVIYESRPEGYPQGQHISLAPNAMRILSHIPGLIPKLQNLGFEYEKLHFRNSNGGRIATFDNGGVDAYGFPAMRIHRRALLEVLTGVCEEKGVEIWYNMKLEGIQEEGQEGRVKMRFQGGEEAEADFVVGVDGLHSVVREYVAPNSASSYAGMLGVTGYLPREKLHSSVKDIELPSHFVGKTGFMAIMPSSASGDEVGFFSTMEHAETKTREEWDGLFHDKEAIRRILLERFGRRDGWCELVGQMCETAEEESLCSWPFFIAPKLPSWTSPSRRVLVMGDAAHALIPTGGLGASLAFEDAECLSRVFKHVAEQPETLDSVMGAWEAHRKERLALVQQFTNRNREIRAPGMNALLQHLKEWALWVALSFVGSDRIAGEIYGYDTKAFEEVLKDLES
ncbi:hypothetical protein M409DRAFT_37178 [Zasmidium cellare ATCC 36951]|uniref:FAD-binding domain-containing protein n=1 Tax=Zasmidium cellare ATCC 36951 TaxID=1080233 RepID=A0A6A6C9R8_ZASCE|nr:uncharacterized protein M409DRAFT_37178 [Zasmidium cellare ATCC 36951]KAF2163791.1 hypothetical protein M409DRAFT_37178 [Zasmidium cellare ATCC 36951]